MNFYPNNGRYWCPPGTIYAQFVDQCPNPCRKYHISADQASARAVADAVLPYLCEMRAFHKVVKDELSLRHQAVGSQAGKFITLYLVHTLAQRNGLIDDLGDRLWRLAEAGLASPNPTIPKWRPSQHVFAEAPLDRGMFIYGGFTTDPTQ